jgi:heat shock protein HslJ
MRALVLLPALMVALLTGACGAAASPAPSSAPPPTEPPLVLEGTSWRATLVGGDAPAPGHDVTLQFEPGRIGGSTGCNSFGGEASLEAGRLVVDEVQMTLAACADALPNRVEGTLLQVLSERPAIITDGSRLLLRGTSGEIVLEPGPRG